MNSSVSEKVHLLANLYIHVRPFFVSTTLSNDIDFEHSSSKRFLAFDLLLPKQSTQSLNAVYVTVDGIGRISHTINLRAYAKFLDSFNDAERTAIRKTRISDNLLTGKEDENPSVLVLEDHDTLGVQLEQWAVEYASKFVHAAGPKFYPTTAAVILGTAYIKKGLPEVSPNQIKSLKYI